LVFVGVEQDAVVREVPKNSGVSRQCLWLIVVVGKYRIHAQGFRRARYRSFALVVEA